nr:hypothetical protein [uncultured Pseudomonas sp.]
MLVQILSIVFPVCAVIAVGCLYGRKHRPDMLATNQVNMGIFVPTLIFSVLASKSVDLAEVQMIALGGLVIVLGSGLARLAQRSSAGLCTENPATADDVQERQQHGAAATAIRPERAPEHLPRIGTVGAVATPLTCMLIASGAQLHVRRALCPRARKGGVDHDNGPSGRAVFPLAGVGFARVA